MKRGAEAPAESEQSEERGPKRLRVEKSVAMTEESMIEDKLLVHDPVGFYQSTTDFSPILGKYVPF